MAAAATFLVYFGLAAFAMEGAFGDLTLAAMWPASGLAVAVLASVDRRARPWHALAVLAASVSASLAFDVPPGRSVLYGLANLAEPLVAVALLSRLPKAGPSLSDPRQLLGFCLAAAGGSVVGTVIASAAVGWSDPIFGIIWFATDFMGIVLVAPPSFQFVAWLKSGRRLRASVKLFYALALVLAADLATFSQGDLPLLFVPTLALIAAASIAGQGGAATGVLLTAVIGSVAGAHGTGPIPANAFGPGTHIYFLQGYLLVMMGSALPMAALHENRQRLIAALTERTRLLVMAERMAGLGHWHLDLEDGGLVWSDEVYRIHGAPDGFKPDLAFALAAYHPDDRQELETVLDAAIRKGGDFRHQARIVRTDGCVRHLLLKGEVIFEDRTAKTLFGVVQDITRQIENEALLEAARLSAEEAAAQATFLAETDALTSVPNRRKVLATLDAMLAAARVDDSSLAVAMFDIDRFKSINDTYGHVVGDAVLRRVALSASATIRAGDVVGRLGGEEFLVLLPGADRLTAMQIGEAVRQRIAAHELGDSEPAATASVGIALLGRDEDAESLLRRADIALYAAKTGGRNVLQVAA